jgi:putative heme-binding domain-containing protein
LSVTELLDNLLSDDRYQTDQSRQVLIERKEETKAALPSWIAAQKSDTGRLQGLWMCQAVGVLEQELLQTLLQSETHQIRAAAVRVLGDWADPSTDLVKPMNLETSLGLFQKSILDEHPRVRLESVRGLAATRSVQGTELALRALERPFDPFLEHGLRLTINENADELIARMKTSGWVDHAENRQQQLEFVLTNVAPDKSASFLQNYISQNGVTAEGPWIELIGRSGSPRQLRALYQGLISDLFQNETKVRAAHALIVAAKRGQRPIGLEQPANRLRQLLDSEKSELRIAALSLLGQWRLSNAIPQVAVIANDLNESLQLRTKAIESLGLIGKQAANELEPIALNETADWSIRQTALKSLARTDFDRSLGPFFKLLSGSQTTEADATSLWRSMLSEKDAAKKILPLIPKDLSKTAAVAGLRVAREGGRVEKKLVEVLMPLADSSSTAELWSPARIPEYVASVEASGDPSKGELIYRRTELQCINCHAIGGVGGKVGPDMTSLGASAPLDYIVESMFDPNAKIKENYHSLVVLTIDGRTVTGIESGSTDEEIVLRDADNKLIRIPTDDVEGSKAGMSLMPAGLLDKISMEERVHLIAFLSQLGKPGDYDASRQNVARSLEIYADTHLTQQRGNEDLIAGREISGWKPMSTRVNGRIPKATLTSLTQQTGNGSLIGVFMRTKIQSNAGEVNLCVDGIAVAEMWIDGQPVTKIAKGDVPKDNNSEQPQVCFQPKLAEGEHVVLVRIDSRDIPEFLLIRSDGVTFVSD